MEQVPQITNHGMQEQKDGFKFFPFLIMFTLIIIFLGASVYVLVNSLMY
ncbi:MAG TPA: hypothetical protein VFZ78_01490 [Flavisolibacter sp.]